MTTTETKQLPVPSRLLINGAWQSGSAGTFADVNPATEEVIADVQAASADDVDSAVRAARTAFEGEWSRVSGADRARLLHRVADLLERDAERLAWLETIDVGKPLAQAAALDIPNAIATFRHFAGWADKIPGSVIETNGYFGRPMHSYTRREPVGVVGAITPWNTPLMIAGWKLAPALAAGNTLVVKPPEDAPLTTLHLAELMLEAGIPAGVVNVVPGLGETAGAALVAHPDVDKISFTGSPEVGRTIQIAAAGTFKRLVLELGGKSPQIILGDADVQAAIQGAAMGLFFNQGEVCAAGTRILVHRSLYDEVVDGLVAAAKAQVVGDPLAPSTTMGALINARQRDRVLSYVDVARAEGATVAAGGERPGGKGYFVQPTVFTDATNEMRVAQEEIFGPVGAVIPFDDVDEAVKIANATQYGLAATIWTRDVSTAHTVAASVRAGAVSVNGWATMDPALPWGGMKTSGVGRELGLSGLLANTEEKTVSIVL
ncbi:phenylacetaldehyde dehydrogenase StyD [Streptomyces sp. NPDC090075]|uniref:phenylacetaldehyde dehydrogenase StyD n=1 Tax=Streptomyces sp. NPDC090075 TaxID=3365937 RepID=UPI00381AB519